MQKDMDDLIGVREATTLLNVSVDWLAGKRHRNQAPSFKKIGSAILYSKKDLITFKQERDRQKLDKQSA
jgi:hypothetical protein